MKDVAQFHDLTGCELSAVCFVRNYVELHFDGPVLRCLAPPAVARGERVLQFPESGSRDGLCELIGLTVSEVQDVPDSLLVHFADDTKLEMLKASPGTGPEVAHFVPLVDGRRDVASMSIWENSISSRDD